MISCRCSPKAPEEHMSMAHLRALLASLPPAALPLSLVCVNAGAMWNIASVTGLHPALVDGAEGVARLCDVTAAIALALSALYYLRCTCAGSARARIAELATLPHIIAHGAGLMSLMSIAAWSFERGAHQFSTLLWCTALLGFLLAELMFVRALARMALGGVGGVDVASAGHSSGFSRCNVSSSGSQSSSGISAPPWHRRLWSAASPPWILPFVGVAASAATGGGLVRFATPDARLQHLALQGPLLLGGRLACSLSLCAPKAALKHCSQPPALKPDAIACCCSCCQAGSAARSSSHPSLPRLW